MDELISELMELHKHWDKNPEFMYTARKCKEAADAVEQAQAKIELLEKHGSNLVRINTERCNAQKETAIENGKLERRIEKLEAALHQAYLDGGCREDEATEMVGALSAGESGK